MKKFLILFLILFPYLLIAQTSIYDIQYTTDAGSGTYPSPYADQTVTTGGIVTAINYLGGRYYISSAAGGAWNGIFVYDNNYSPAIGDSIVITGTVTEYSGYTEIKSLTSFSVKSTGNTLPDAAQILSNEITSEAYEGVLVEINDCFVTSVYDSYGNFQINDGSGANEIRSGIFSLKDYGFPLMDNYSFTRIIGVIGINYGSISVQPRDINDFQSNPGSFVLSTSDKTVETEGSFSYPVNLSILNQSEIITSYSLVMQYDPAIIQYTGFSKSGTISEPGTITDESIEGNIELNFTGNIICNEIETLINLNFTTVSVGNANIQFSISTINGNDVMYYSSGELLNGVAECNIPIGDTLTIVQRPLLNIPTIVIPRQDLSIVCFAPESTTGWNAQLVYDDHTVDLEISQSNYDSDLDRWTLTTNIPTVDFYELYDLRVTADGGILDDVTNAVKIIDTFKDDYYFIHITDLHLLGHTFYGDAGYETDESEMDDLYEVIKDINLLNPEFVLLTGDLINEGELEDFECLRNFTKAVELLEKFEVPVYIVPGNHDLGGWDATPPPQGTSRREWWRFFGWRQREIPPTETEYLTHDYSFDYGNVHYTGLEAYDNYDSYMYDVYGPTSFIPSQITWLQNDLQNAGDKTKVLFYHYDFKHELDFSALDVDMALWGHTHSDYNNGAHPYNISTASVCDGNRTFRVIRVNGNNLNAESSVHTHSSGDMLTLNYNMVNDGSLNLVSATVQNNYSLNFDHGLVKFVMPPSEFGYNVTNGRLIQFVENTSTVTCYVEVSIPANGQITTTIEKISSSDITSVYDIQHTTEAGDGTYPSMLNGQTVTTGGIVTATGYLYGRFFISSSQGGAWNGILVYDNNYSPVIGDSVLITGTVSEYNGSTELLNVTSFQVISSGNDLPDAVSISTNEIENEEFEGVLVEVNNCAVSTVFDQNGNFAVNDGTGSCEIRPGIYSLMNDDFVLINDYNFKSIKGVVAYTYGVTSIQPRSLADILAADDGFIIITDDSTVDNNSEINYPVKISMLQSAKEINTYSLKVQYDNNVFQYNGYDKESTISESGSISDLSATGVIELNYSGTANLIKNDTLLKLKFTPLSTGVANVQLAGSNFNGHNLLFSIIGNLQSTYTNTTSISILENTSGLNIYPNPFCNKVYMEYETKQAANVYISVHNMAGQLIKVLVNQRENSGRHVIKWDATNSSGNNIENGIYFYKFLLNGEQVDMKQIIYIK